MDLNQEMLDKIKLILELNKKDTDDDFAPTDQEIISQLINEIKQQDIRKDILYDLIEEVKDLKNNQDLDLCNIQVLNQIILTFERKQEEETENEEEEL